MFDTDIHPDIPTDELLAEIGLDPRAVGEVIADDRAMRCPDRDQVRPDRGTAFLDVVMPHETGMGEAAQPENPIPARRPAEWRRREAWRS